MRPQVGEVGGNDGGPMGGIGDNSALTLAGKSDGSDVAGVVGIDATLGVDGRDKDPSIFSTHMALRSRKIKNVNKWAYREKVYIGIHHLRTPYHRWQQSSRSRYRPRRSFQKELCTVLFDLPTDRVQDQ